MRKHAITLIKLLILAGIIAWIAWAFDTKDWHSLVNQEKNWSLLAVSFGLVLVAHIVSFVRWHIFVVALEVPFSVIEAIRLGFLGNLFNFVSLGAVGGDLFKAIAAAKLARQKRPEVIASVLVDRALGLLGLVLVAAISLQVFGDRLSKTLDWIRIGAWVLAVVGVCTLILIVAAGHLLPLTWLQRLPLVGHTIHRMTRAAMLFEGRPGLVVTLTAMSCLFHILLTLGMYFVSIALYSDTPTLKEHFLIVPPAFAAAALPLTPGGVGVQEMAVAKLFEELPELPTGFSGLIVAAMYRLELIVVAAIGGIYYFFGAREIEIIRQQAE